ncbi:MAG: decarboxylating 6-phosphogluconate dehydrogenase [Candidatus Marsarchaeota archaeon]|nr:decarboxylating 6-phosphogluconate dehydrogenase [Candidatus Marsarchaeota archaeon]
MKKQVIGLYGLGKMGGNIALNMIRNEYPVILYNRSKDIYKNFKNNAYCANSIEDFVKKLRVQNKEVVIWLMLTSGEPTNSAIDLLLKLLRKGDIVIDGSNSMYLNSVANSEKLGKKGIMYLDAGCSGGPSGALNGMSIMVGGNKDAFKRLENLFKDLSVEGGYKYVGEAGSGHFVKMVHNAIEYGMMQSIGEGLELLSEGPYKNLDLEGICDLWNHGSVIRGYLIELAKRALEKDAKLSKIEPFVEDSGEGRWSVETAVNYAIPLPAITHSLYERFSSRSKNRFSNKVLAALRHEFGGHEVKNIKK